jgi:hypothetical protein
MSLDCKMGTTLCKQRSLNNLIFVSLNNMFHEHVMVLRKYLIFKKYDSYRVGNFPLLNLLLHKINPADVLHAFLYGEINFRH